MGRERPEGFYWSETWRGRLYIRCPICVHLCASVVPFRGRRIRVHLRLTSSACSGLGMIELKSLICFDNVSKSYTVSEVEIHALGEIAVLLAEGGVSGLLCV